MHQQSFFIRLGLIAFFVPSYSIAGSGPDNVYYAAVGHLSEIFYEEAWNPEKAISRFQRNITPILKENNFFYPPTVARIFRSAFVLHLTELEISSHDELLVKDFSFLANIIDEKFPSDLEPWQTFCNEIKLFEGKNPKEDIIKEAFEKVRQKTKSSYLGHSYSLRLMINTLAAFNSMPDNIPQS